MSRPQNPEYADPVIREPSPASSVGTVYGPDQTTSSDEELDQADFERKWEAKLNLRLPTKAEEDAELHDPLLPRPSTAVEEQEQFQRTLNKLRAAVEELEENELFEQTMLRGSQAALEEEMIPNDIDTLMLSMMGGSSRITTADSSANANATVTDGPWNKSRYEGGGALPKQRTKGKSRTSRK
jgi:hypothetical protein